mmetsp:Transcript_1220/g.2953  ORF Transcript_1220/g.2953 Transcript_1220/m.2953 type:complete len:872 (+) Transcript_1220:61-2676(+)
MESGAESDGSEQLLAETASLLLGDGLESNPDLEDDSKAGHGLVENDESALERKDVLDDATKTPVTNPRGDESDSAEPLKPEIKVDYTKASVTASGSLDSSGDEDTTEENRQRPPSTDGDADVLLAQTAALLAGSEEPESGSEIGGTNLSKNAIEACNKGQNRTAEGSLEAADEILRSPVRGSGQKGASMDSGYAERDVSQDEDLDGDELLAETNALLTGVRPSQTTAKPKSPQEAVAEQAVQGELSRIQKRMANDVTLVCCGSGVHLRDLFLLDTCLCVPLRVDLSNEDALHDTAEALKSHGYEVRAKDAGQLRASYEPTVEELKRLASPTSSPKAAQPGSLSASIASSMSMGDSSTLESSAQSLQVPSLTDEPRQFVSKAVNFSLGKIQNVMKQVDTLQLKRGVGLLASNPGQSVDRGESSASGIGSSTSLDTSNIVNMSRSGTEISGSSSQMRIEPYASAAVGVEVESKQRCIFVCGAEHETEALLRTMIQLGMTRLPSGVHSLHADYVRDLEEAWRLAAERKLHELVRPKEKEMLAVEYQAAQLVSFVKAEYRAYGVQIPELERPPFVSQLPLTYDSDEADDEASSGAQDAKLDLELAGAEAEDVSLRNKLSRRWSREVAARTARKERQLQIRREICARNKALLLQRLRDSEVARTSRDTLVLCSEMKINPSVILGHVSCIFERRPGRLLVTFDHLLFSSKVLGFKRSLAIPLTNIAHYGGMQTTGAAAIVGAAALAVQDLTTGAPMRFIMGSKLDCDRVLALLQQIETMRRALAESRQRRSSRESKGSIDQDVQRSSFDDTLPPHPPSQSSSSLAQYHSMQDEESTRVGMGNTELQENVKEPTDVPTKASLEKMMESTYLNDDEEAF